MERETTIKKLFHEDGIQFAIPAYQRAYSWELDTDKKQVKQFINDIKDQNPNKNYFLGHFLFEKDTDNESKYWVIDGQQRITTVIIFFSTLIKELEKRETEEGNLVDLEGEELEVWRIRENYIKLGRKNYKFQTVSYDNPFFEFYIYGNNSGAKPDTASARRIDAAKKAFEDLFSQAPLEELLNWKKIIDNAVITTFEVKSKVQATQIFAFQNDRGKDLTTLEKLKAFIMHKLYAVSENDAESQIRHIETIFSDIYKQAERISFNEDQVLNFHNTAFLSGWDNPLQNVKDELNKLQDNAIKEQWIINFVHNLKQTFISIEKIEKQSEVNCYISDILILNTQSSMPLLIKLYHYHNELENIEKMAKYIETILFKLEYKTADYRTNGLPNIAKHYSGDLFKLESELKHRSMKGFQDWWNFTGNCIYYFTTHNWHYHNKIKYILWKYENSLRSKNRTRLITPVEFRNKFGNKNTENTTDHITPREPDFTTYTEEFKQKFLNNIGNLSLMVWGDNSEKKNHSPLEKINLFDSDFYSHKEIRDTLNSRQSWGELEITERKEKILDFIYKNWDLN